ncbi:phosphoribosyltransferase [Mucilaginibacter daejeonensis]|uniref:phosphoribosyltransferase family protein n=1 Tax=Mucilaginibacter daejeonensis TaxID=398049 RepID=UPI001D17D30E|nr:phosphoribosyltransferase family protein [Mucilaginibacter daejeonensis]UEG53543.1 phosphoribosyltransferase [Mucilaginibacter daejeonensis]
MPDKILILNHQQIQQKLDRIAYQILEDNFEEEEVVIAGILSQGSVIAGRLKAVLEKIAPFKISMINIQIEKNSSHLQFSVDTDIKICENKAVILVDDVLNSGKTLAYGFGVFLDVPLKKLRTVVLVDRNHKSFPVSTDYAGIALSTVLKQHVYVSLNESGEDDAVYLG